MGIKHQLLILSLLFLIATTILAAKSAKGKFNYRAPQITCKYLRHVYKNQWYEPQCRSDGGMLNPQCFYPGHNAKICCCTYRYPLVGRAIKWIGQCERYITGSAIMPICRGPKMLNKSSNKKGKNKTEKNKSGKTEEIQEKVSKVDEEDIEDKDN